MKHWCYYTDVVRYLERLERVSAKRTQVPGPGRKGPGPKGPMALGPWALGPYGPRGP